MKRIHYKNKTNGHNWFYPSSGFGFNEGGQGLALVVRWDLKAFYVAFWTKTICPRLWLSLEQPRFEFRFDHQ